MDFNFSMAMSDLQGSLAELKEELTEAGESETADDLNALETKLDKLEALDESDESKKKARGSMNKLKRLLNNLDDENSSARKALDKVRGGVGLAQDLAKKYNSIAQWGGFPQVPDVFLKKS